MIEDDAKQIQTGMKLRWRLLFSLLFYGPAIYLLRTDGDYVAAALCVVAGIAAFGGYRAGAVCIFSLLGAFTAAIAFAPSLGVAHEARFTQWFGTTGLTNRFVAVGTVGLLIAIAGTLILGIVGRRFIRRRPRLESANRWIGFGLGSLEGAAAVVLLLGGMLIVEPIEKERAPLRDPTDVRGRFVSKLILRTSQLTRESVVGPTIVAYNPFHRIPQLNVVEEVQQSVQVLSDPVKINGLMHHPAIQQLQRRPEVREVVAKLNADPEIQEILRSGRKMDRSMALTLLSHPAVMELVDQPGFVEEAAKVIGEAGRGTPGI